MDLHRQNAEAVLTLYEKEVEGRPTRWTRTSPVPAVKAFESWTRTMQQPVGQVSGAVPTPGIVDLNPIVDQLFDFADATLQLQRQFAKRLLWASTQAVQAAQPRSGDEEVMEGG